jgi:hypothetical protein
MLYNSSMNAIYPWTLWLSAEAVIEVEQFVDFYCSVAAFRCQVHAQARRRGRIVVTEATEDGLRFRS